MRYTVEKITERMGRAMSVPEYSVKDSLLGNRYRCDSRADAEWLAMVLNERNNND